MEHPDTGAVPSGHTKGGGVLIGSDRVPRQLVLFEDPQCPYCRQFEEASGELLRRLVETEAVAIEYRMRCFLGVESVRADNALALAAEAGRFDELRRQMFADQPAESTGGYTVDDLIDRGRQVGLSSPDYQQGVRDERYARWVVGVDRVFQRQDPKGTPAGLLDGRPVSAEVLYDPPTLRRMIQPEDARTRDVAASTKWQIWGRCSYAAIRATSSLPTSRNRSTAVRSALRPGSPGSISASASSAVTWAAATTRPAGMR